jgi:hypothetical protein
LYSYDLTLEPNMENTDLHLVQFQGLVSITLRVLAKKGSSIN